ncbi:MAG: helix-turn-helix domain-containing protein [Desulfohalobiaceae bacterium]|nr:helix-turn-helix domain-containing protein [Desulfohalobiaceae bacterium]
MQHLKDVVRPDQAARRLNCSRNMIYKLLSLGKLGGFKVGASWNVYVKSVEDYKNSSHTSHSSHTSY